MSRKHYKGIVSRVNDPKNQGRIRVKCQELAGAGVEIPAWIRPMWPFASKGSACFFFVPEVGSEVTLSVLVSSEDDESYGESFILHPDIRYWAGDLSAKNPLPSEFKTDYPQRRGFKTPGGGILMFDDKGKNVKLGNDSDKAFLELKSAGVLVAAAATVKLGSDNASEPVVKGNTQQQNDTTMHTSMQSAYAQLLSAGAALTSAAPFLSIPISGPIMASPLVATAAGLLTAAATALNAAITAYEAAKAANLSTVSKTD